MKKILLTATALCAASAQSFAAELETPEFLAKERNTYIAVGPAFQSIDFDSKAGIYSGIAIPDKMAGVSFDYGRYFGRSDLGHHEAGVNAGLLIGTESTGPVDTTLIDSSVSAYYNYNFQVGSKTKIYVGPRLGFTRISLEYDGGAVSDEGSDTVLKYGIGVGVKQQFTDTFGMGLGLEQSMYGDVDMGGVELTSISSTKIVLNFSWNF